jgi:hypothetical protein
MAALPQESPEARAYFAATKRRSRAMAEACRAYDAHGAGSPEERAALRRLEGARAAVRRTDAAYRAAAGAQDVPRRAA